MEAIDYLYIIETEAYIESEVATMHVLELTLFIIVIVANSITDSSINIEQYECYEDSVYEEPLEEEPVIEAVSEETYTSFELEESIIESIHEEPVIESVIEETVTYVQPGDLGVLRIPDANIEVGLYSDDSAFQSSGKASVQYYAQYGIKWVADHANQDGFGNLKYLSIGSKVYINETEYTVVESVYAEDYYSNFGAWVSYIDDSKLLLQTCEGNGARLVRCE